MTKVVAKSTDWHKFRQFWNNFEKSWDQSFWMGKRNSLQVFSKIRLELKKPNTKTSSVPD